MALEAKRTSNNVFSLGGCMLDVRLYTHVMAMSATARLTVISFLLFMARGMTIPVSSVTWRSMGASYWVICLLGTVTSLITIVANPVWGKASDATGRRRTFLTGGLLAMALGHAAVTLIPGYPWLYPVLGVTAMAQAAYDTASLALIGDWLEHDAETDDDETGRSTSGRRMGIYRGLGSLGFGLMAFLSGTIADRLSLRTPFALAAALLLLGAALSLSVREAPDAQGDDQLAAAADAEADACVAPSLAGGHARPTQSLRPPRPIRSPSPLPVAPLMVAALLWSLVVGAVYAVWGNYMVEEIGYTAAQMTRLWSLASLSEFPLMIAAGWLSDRIGRLPTLAIGAVAWAVVFGGYLIAPGMPWILAVQLTRGFAYSAHTAAALTYAAEVRSRGERGRVSGYYGTANGIGSILGSGLGGGVVELAGFRALLGSCAAAIAAGGVYLGSVASRYRRRLRGRT